MPPTTRKPLYAAPLLAILIMLAEPASASGVGHDGKAILRMCQGAERVKALSVMCHSYLNGYLDATAWRDQAVGKKRPDFCLHAGDKEKVPGKLVLWLRAHPKDQDAPAPEMLGKAFKDLFPCH